MLTKLTVSAMPRILKSVDGNDATERGAFSVDEIIDFTVEAPRKLGASAVVLRICKDGEQDRDFPFLFTKTSEGIDEYRLSLSCKELCGKEEQGLFFYELLFLRGFDTLFTSTHNQVDFTLQSHSEQRFALSVYRSDYSVPAWFSGRIMYHVFVDRFCRGEGAVTTRDDVILNKDWENGIPQYAEQNGDSLANNMFFGGNLWGIAEKIPYLKSLGVGILYLSPIFRAYSNHKYDTGDYLEIDGMFGGEEAFRHLLRCAREADIRIILDGVFNHTGNNSRYFDRFSEYGGNGAYGNHDSPYRDWYCWQAGTDKYETWWGIEILPKLNLHNKECCDFLSGRGGVAEHYIKMGIDGWRLDVADELLDEFLDQLRRTVKNASNGQGIIIGEVWENAALKEAYGRRRRYFGGNQLDSVMNYPLRNGILSFLLDGDAVFLADILKEIYATYPRAVCDSLMNLLGTHDTERILTVLGEGNDRNWEESNEILSTKRLNKEQYQRGVALLKIAAAIQYTVYGVPSVFYGDEAGIEGYHDPFCRRTYPWGKENAELLNFYRRLGDIRSNHSAFDCGDFYINQADGGFLAYTRTKNEEKITILVNRTYEEHFFELPTGSIELLSEQEYLGVVPANSVLIVKQMTKKEKTSDGIHKKND
ncbi:MAG: glycoside hydrolase family 13 protein [Clostridia bacterium]|nr:glycoside hydrolase family 13 protein [Clostridia bacterium]